jgi:ComF family protein
LPNICYSCKEKELTTNNIICIDCLSNINPILEPSCTKCGYPLYDNTFLGKVQNVLCHECEISKRNFDFACSAFEYNDLARKIVLDFKFYYNTQVIRFVASSIAKKVNSQSKKIDIICIVPSSSKKVIKKGFCHTALLGIEIAKLYSNTEYVPDLLLQKKIDNKSQKDLMYHERISKKHNFTLNNKYLNTIKNANILLIDDVITTCSTIQACSKELRKLKKCKIIAASFARTILY